MAPGKSSAPVRAETEKLWASIRSTARAVERLTTELQRLDPAEVDAVKQARGYCMQLSLGVLDLAVAIGGLESAMVRLEALASE